MWNSPQKFSDLGKQYRPEEVTVLLEALGDLWEHRESRPVDELVDERILVRLEKDELIYAIYQTLEAILEPVPIPEKGHTGIQEAVVAELLSRARDSVALELDSFGCEDTFHARCATWNSVHHLILKQNSCSGEFIEILEEFGVDPLDSEVYRSPRLTSDCWDLLFDFLESEFLWDEDWRMDSFMDLPPERAVAIGDLIGMDLGVVQALPQSPVGSELKKAERYISEVISKTDAIVAHLMRKDSGASPIF